jgi:hypothetical protein
VRRRFFTLLRQNGAFVHHVRVRCTFRVLQYGLCDWASCATRRFDAWNLVEGLRAGLVSRGDAFDAVEYDDGIRRRKRFECRSALMARYGVPVDDRVARRARFQRELSPAFATKLCGAWVLVMTKAA